MKSPSTQKEDRSENSYQSVPIWKLFKYADSTDWWLVGLGTFGAIGDGLYLPVLLAVLTNVLNTLGNGPSSNGPQFLSNIRKFSLILVYLAIALGFAAFLEGFCWTRTAERQTARMRRKYLKAVLRQDVGFFDTQGTTTSVVVASVSTDTFIIQTVFSDKIPSFLMNMATFFGSYIFGLFLTWRLAIVISPFVILLIIPGIMYGRILVGIAHNIREAYDKAGNIAEQAVSSVRTVFSFVGEERTMTKFGDALHGTVKLGIKQGLMKGMAVGSTGLTFCTWSFIAWYGSRLVMYHGISGGKIFSAGICFVMGGLGLGTAIPNIRYFSEACGAARRILDMIERVPIIDSDDSKGEILEQVRGEVEFRNVEFAYPSRPESLVFRNFSLTIPPSKTVALVGGSGSGKSTAVALVERFYDPLGGQILLDGVDMRELNLKWLRSQIGLVSQEPALFATSIKENILFGKEGGSMEDVIAAAQAANAHKFITQLPNGYETQVGERGVQMSGGQKQRIAIARAMIRDPRILVLDEATSALDAESEKIVQEALDNASIGRTTLIIAHRLSTIRNADFIAVVHGGHVIESGQHSDLISRDGGAYATLVQLQEMTSHLDESEDQYCDLRDAAHARGRSSSFVSKSSSYRSISVHPEQEKQQQEVVSSAPSFRRLLMLNAPEWKQALLGCLGAIVFGAVQPTYSFFSGAMLSVFFFKDHDKIKSETKKYSLIFFCIGVISFVFSVVQHYNFAVMGEYLTKRVRESMLAKIFTFEIGWFDQEDNSSGAICTMLEKEANVMRSLVGDRASLIVQAVSAVLIAFTMSLILAWRLALVLIAAQPLIIACFYSRKVIMTAMAEKAVKGQGRGSQVASEAVGNHRTITAFSSQDKILNLFKETQEGPRRDNMKQSWFAGLVLAASQSLSMLNAALTYWYGGHQVYDGHISPDAFFKTYFVLMSTARVIAEAGTMTSDIAQGSDALISVFNIFDREAAINPDDGEGEKPEKIEGNIDVRNVDFAYPSRPDVMIFNKFSLSIKAGQRVALVGQSGSGKSTIIGLIERFYDPLKGVVRIDGKDITEFNLRSLRQHIGLVGQEPTLFAGSIRDNICYGKQNATEAEMIEAAKAANAHDFISCLEDGYDTQTGERGVQLSGGQKKRITIARAIIKNPSILLLDEATNALDSQSEKVVQDALDRVMVGRTSVIIAHRLSTIRDADSIAVIRDGRVAEQGSHFHLMGKGDSGAYFALVNMQSFKAPISLE
ncbi:hypothetical protein SUGI_0739320 [Cryptomeria japonica]|uniref:putative multidrug resistance protein n=1 Tax=Cryptomeria japonica TaxID=3369 RepID=UPI002414C054|nr:putative multidrug resistance protein [Cryptomeria japonica]GLJ36728.1 hypothetical protein SUGI_0739320 [Cryptomeria japonica]